MEPLDTYKHYLQKLPEGCQRIFSDWEEAMIEAPGSSANHQTWPGGFIDHSNDIFCLAERIYPIYTAYEEMGFSLQSALLVLFAHDLEKPFKYASDKTLGEIGLEKQKQALTDPDYFKLQLLEEYGVLLNEEEMNALKYIHGEGNDYQKGKRVAGKLAAFCHICDFSSARIFYNRKPEKSFKV